MNRLLGLIAATLMFTTSAMASESPVYTGLLSNTGAGGYDTVSYFETGQPTKGDPKHWSIREGRLYLNYNQSVQDQWLENPDGFIRQADVNWPKVLE